MRTMSVNALFCRSMSLLLGAEVPLDAALALTADILPAGAPRRAVREAGLRVAAGEPPGTVLGGGRILSPLIRFALEWPGGRGGAAVGFDRITSWFQSEAKRMSERLLFATELAAVLLAGLLAGTVVTIAWAVYFNGISNP
jgi:general secretion pathway protein F